MLIKSRRPRRNRYLQISIFIVIYSCYYAYSAAVIKDEATEMPDEVTSMFTTIETTEVYERRLGGASDRLVIKFIVGSARQSNGRNASAAPWVLDVAALARELLSARNRTISEPTNEQEHTQSNGSFSYIEYRLTFRYF